MAANGGFHFGTTQAFANTISSVHVYQLHYYNIRPRFLTLPTIRFHSSPATVINNEQVTVKDFTYPHENDNITTQNVLPSNLNLWVVLISGYLVHVLWEFLACSLKLFNSRRPCPNPGSKKSNICTRGRCSSSIWGQPGQKVYKP